MRVIDFAKAIAKSCGREDVEFYKIPIRNNIEVFIQSQGNVNKMLEAKKINEIKSDIFIKQDEEDKNSSR